MNHRHSPVRHRVRQYHRHNTRVASYMRGHGKVYGKYVGLEKTHLSDLADPTMDKEDLKYVRNDLHHAEKQMTEEEKQYVLKNISMVRSWPESKSVLSSKDRDKVFVTFDFRYVSLNCSLYNFGGTFWDRYSTTIASYLIHEATHNLYENEIEPTKKTRTFIERKVKEKPTYYNRMLLEAVNAELKDAEG